MPYISGSKKGQLNRCDVKKLYVEKFGESPPTSWNRDKIMVQLEKIKVKKVEVKEEVEVIEEVNHVLETVESVEVPVEEKKKGRKKKN
tara:strand:- start:90 stop:353 length:264 start_codon:yes stop_codon:yes gene_type:complete